MNVPGDDFLAGARLAAHEHGRVRLRDLGRLLQHVPPFCGLAHDADLSFRFELLGEHLHARFELLGARLRLRGLPLRADEHDRGELLKKVTEREFAREGRQQVVEHGQLVAGVR
jgi:hypothetical protein